MVCFTSLPKDFNVLSTRSLTMGLQPPQPVVALVALITSERLLQLPSLSTPHICPLLTLSQEQICAVSGRSSTLAELLVSAPRDPRMRSSGFSGSFIWLLYNWKRAW